MKKTKLIYREQGAGSSRTFGAEQGSCAKIQRFVNKQRLRTVIFLVSLSSFLFYFGCSDVIFEKPETVEMPAIIEGEVVAGEATVNVNIGGNGRTLLPQMDGFKRYELSATNGTKTVGPVPADKYGGRINITYGEWTIIATAFVEIEGVDYAVATGSKTLTVEDSEHWIDIFITMPQAGGYGTFAYTVRNPSDAGQNIVRLQPWPLPSTAIVDNSAVVRDTPYSQENVPSGIYFLTVIATVAGADGPVTYTRNEIVHIYDKLTTNAVFSFYSEEYVGSFTYGEPYQNIMPLTSYVDYDIYNYPMQGRYDVMKVTEPNNFSVAVIDLRDYAGEQVRISFYAQVKREGSRGDLMWQINNPDEWPIVSHYEYAPENEWHPMGGEIFTTLTADFPCLYLNNDDQNATYYIDNFEYEIEVLTINLAGSVDFRINGARPDYTRIVAVDKYGRYGIERYEQNPDGEYEWQYRDYGNSYINQNNWSIKFDKYEYYYNPMEVLLIIEYGIGTTSGRYHTGVSRTIYRDSIYNIDLGYINYDPRKPRVVFYESNGWDEPGNEEWARWGYDLNEDWVLNGEIIEQGDIFKLTYTFTSNIDISWIGSWFLDRQAGGWEPLINWTNLLTTASVTSGVPVTQTIFYTPHTGASSNHPEANTFRIEIDRIITTRPIFDFSHFELEKVSDIPIEDSLSEWTVSGITFKVNNPRTNTVANPLDSYQGKTNVLHIKPGAYGYAWSMLEYDLIDYAGQDVTITITTDAWMSREAKVAWQINADPWPVICGTTELPVQGGQWHSLSGTRTVSVPNNANPDDNTGRLLYLSSMQIGGADVYFANFTVTIEQGSTSGTGIDISFVSPVDEQINLTANNAVRLGDTFNVSVTGYYDSYMWFVNGDEVPGNTNTNSIPTDRSMLGRQNTIAVVVSKAGVLYSKELFFWVTE